MNSLDPELFDVKFVYATPSGSGSYLSDLEIGLVGIEDSYEQLPQKTYSLIKFIRTWYSNHYYSIFKCNDDIFIDGESFNKISFCGIDYAGKFNFPIQSANELDKIARSSVIHWNKCKSEYHIPKKVYPGLFYVEGSGCYLNQKSMDAILQSSPSLWNNTPETYKGEDVAIGLALSGALTARYISSLEMRDTKNVSKTINCPLDIWENGTLIHPIHFSLMDRLYELKNVDDRLQLIYDNPSLNDYVIRDANR